MSNPIRKIKKAEAHYSGGALQSKGISPKEKTESKQAHLRIQLTESHHSKETKSNKFIMNPSKTSALGTNISKLFKYIHAQKKL